jgi:metallophosphoesterase, MG_246/BB_0505 family
MPITVLCVGDVVGKPGRLVLAELLPKLIAERKIDLVVVNAENSAGGSGLTPAIYTKLLSYGIDVVTLGDHTYRKREVLPLLETSERLIRPGNYPASSVGRGWTVVTSRSGVKVAVFQVMGRLFMNQQVDDPLRCIDKMLLEIPRDVKVKIVDFHAEASSEKIAMGWHLDGRVSVNFGTHTHTPTADFRVLPAGTAFVSDLGMTGPYDSVLGRRKDRVLKHQMTGMPQFFEVATGDPRMGGVLVRIDEMSGLALSIERCDVKGTEQAGAYDADDGKGGSPGGEM